MFAAGLSCWNSAITPSKIQTGSQVTMNHHKLSITKVQYEKCSSSIASETRQFGYNLTTEDTPAKQWHFLDSAPTESQGRLRGEITVNRGDLFQASDIEVRVIITSNNEGDLKNVHLKASSLALGLDYLITDENEICTDVQVLIYLRPWPKRLLNILDIRSEVLDITFKDMLNWHVNNLVVHTSHGNSWYNSSHLTDPFIAQNITVSSKSGDIFGEYAANGNLAFENVHGHIGIIMIPMYGRPFNLESISALTSTATIHVEADFTCWPTQPHTHITNIHTRSGELWAYIPHGSYTNLSSIRNILVTRLKPYGTPSPHNPSEIYTYSESGYTHVRVDDADPDTLKDLHNPLLNTTSKHYLGSGTLWLRYPYSWFGNVQAQIEHGPLDFDASALEELEKSEGLVKAKRGKKGESQLDIQVGTGALDIELGLG
ncbi:Nn.00g049450.m01.CDS01 [Neocucurbitaria sp. VM-36]